MIVKIIFKDYDFNIEIDNIKYYKIPNRNAIEISAVKSIFYDEKTITIFTWNDKGIEIPTESIELVYAKDI